MHLIFIPEIDIRSGFLIFAADCFIIFTGMVIGKQTDSANRIKLLERELIQTRNETEKAHKLKSEFLASISHEIRTPMNSIIGYTNLLKDDEKDLQKLNKLNIILHAGNILLDLINELLDFSRIEAGEVTLELINFSLKGFFTGIKNIFADKAKEKHLSFSIHLDPNLPNMVCGDERRIQQIVSHLLGNAIKFTPEGSISLRCLWKSGNLEIHVTDTGIGIPEEQCLYIFSAFKQADSVFTREYGGTGLGLTIAQKLIDLMKGSISVKSAIGEGSTFTVILPLQEIISETPVQQSQKIEEDTKKFNSKKFLKDLRNMKLDYRVLVAEDNKLIREYFQDLLNLLGVHYDSAANGEIVLEKLSNTIKTGSNFFDLLLLDINMPILSGLEVIKFIRSDKNFNNLHVIAVSGYTEESDITMYLTSGCNSYLSKPVKKQDFFDKVIPLMLKKHKILEKDVNTTEEKPASKSMVHSIKLEEHKKIALRRIIERMKKSYEIFDPQEIQRLGEELKTIIPEEQMSYYSEKITSVIQNYDDEILRKLIIEMEEAYV